MMLQCIATILIKPRAMHLLYTFHCNTSRSWSVSHCNTMHPPALHISLQHFLVPHLSITATQLHPFPSLQHSSHAQSPLQCASTHSTHFIATPLAPRLPIRLQYKTSHVYVARMLLRIISLSALPAPTTSKTES